jgi:hypothetical protein
VGHSEVGNARAGEGSVLVDVGGGAGALILQTGPDMAGAEIEISPVGQDDLRRHVAVLTRVTADGDTLHAAVFAGLPAGTWQLWDPLTDVEALSVTIVDGEVTNARWA